MGTVCNCDIKYKSTDAHANASSLSKLSLQSSTDYQLNGKAPSY